MQLRDFCSIQSGFTPRGGLETRSKGMLAIQLGDVAPDTDLDVGSLSRIEKQGVSARHLVGAGDVLFRSRGAHAYAYALSADISEPAVAIMPLFIIRPVADVADPRYVAWYLNQPAAQRHFAGGATGSNLRMIGKPVLEEVDVDLPPLDKQTAIAELSSLAARERTLSNRSAARRYDLMALRLGDLAHISSQVSTSDRTIP